MSHPPLESGTSVAALRRRYLGPLLASLLSLRAAVLFLCLATYLPIYTDITYPEGALVARALDVVRGDSPYHDWRQWPHHFSPYPPLAYYPVGWLARLVTAQPTPYAVYRIGRAFSYATLCGILIVLYLLGRRLGLSRLWSLAALGLLAEMRIVMEFATSYRPDGPKTLFALLALLFAARGRPTARTVTAALACLMVSFWFKPTAWGIALVLAVWIWRGLGARRALAIGAAFAAAGLIPLFLLNHHWEGLLWLNIVDSLRNGLTLDNVAYNFKFVYLPPLLIVCLGLFFVAASLRERAPAPGRPILFALPVCLLVNLVQFFKVGADINYFIDAYPLAVLAVAWGCFRLWHAKDFPLIAPLRAIFLGLVLMFPLPVLVFLVKYGLGLEDFMPHLVIGYLVAALAVLAVLARRWRGGTMPSWLREAMICLCLAPLPLFGSVFDLAMARDDIQKMRACWFEVPPLREARLIQGSILATQPFILLTHEEPVPLDYFQYACLCRRGLLDPAPLLSRVRARQFSTIILSDPALSLCAIRTRDGSELFCKEFLPLLKRHYYPLRKVGIFNFFVPRP